MFKDDKKTLSNSGKVYTTKKDGTANSLYTGFLGVVYFEKGEKAAQYQNGKLLAYDKGKLTNKIYDKEIKDLGKYGNLTAWIGNTRYVDGKETYKKDKDGKVKNVSENKVVSQWIGIEFFENGVKIARLDKGIAYEVKNDKITSTKIKDRFLNKRYYRDGKKIAEIYDGYVYEVGQDGNINMNKLYSKNDLKTEGLIAATWINNTRYANGKATFTKTKDTYGRVTNMNGKLATTWIGNEYYLNGSLRVAYKEENGKKYAFIVRDGKISDDKVEGFAGSKLFEKGELIAVRKGNILYEVKDGKTTETKLNKTVEGITYKDGVKVEETATKAEETSKASTTNNDNKVQDTALEEDKNSENDEDNDLPEEE